MGVKADILAALAARLQTITAANGYSTPVTNVYWDKIPMGIELNDYQLPAIFIIDKTDSPEMEHRVIKGNWEVGLQLWQTGDKSDLDMLELVRNVYKSLYANSATAQVNDAFRLTSQVVELIPVSMDTDLNMIEANRVYDISFSIRYRTNLFNL
jgi:hypothetical protein